MDKLDSQLLFLRYLEALQSKHIRWSLEFGRNGDMLNAQRHKAIYEKIAEIKYYFNNSDKLPALLKDLERIEAGQWKPYTY